jgi:chromosome segregation ATPase
MYMRRHLICSCMAAVLALFSICDRADATGHKTAELEQKTAEISSLQNDLSGKISRAIEKREQLTEKMEALKKEIKQEKEQWQIDSFQKALQNARIDYNLKLIQLLLGYITGLTHKIVYLQNGNEILDFFLQQVRDDLLMIKTLNNLEIDKLIAQINSVLDEFIPEIGEPMFDVDDIPLEDTEKIWNEIVN